MNKKALLALIPLFAGLPLFVRSTQGFNLDWYNSVWLGLYQSITLQSHALFPDVMHTATQIGFPFPLFYGYFFYPVLGVLITLFGTYWGIRSLVLLVLFCQFFFVQNRIEKISRNSTLAVLISTALFLSPYQLTNIYNRNALPEFVAFVFLTMSWLEAMYGLSLPRGPKRTSSLQLSIVLLVGVVGVHVITTLYGIPFYGLTVLPVWWVRARAEKTLRQDFQSALAPLILSALIVLPYLYLLLHFGPHTNQAGMKHTWPYFLEVDKWWVRLLPFPYDPRSELHGVNLETPYLDTQISFPLLLLAAFSYWKFHLKRAALVPIFLLSFTFLFLLFLSTSYPMHPVFLPVFRMIQFSYRYTNYLNLILLALTVYAITQRSPITTLRRDHFFVTFCWGLIFCATSLKLVHSLAILDHADRRQFKTVFRSNETAVQFPPSFYGMKDYGVSEATDTELHRVDREVAFPASFNPLESMRLSFEQIEEKPQWIETNVYAFPWNHLYLDGRILQPTERGIHYPHYAVKVEDKGQHRLEYRYEPPTFFKVLQALSRLACGVLLAMGLTLLLTRKKMPSLKLVKT